MRRERIVIVACVGMVALMVVGLGILWLRVQRLENQVGELTKQITSGLPGRVVYLHENASAMLPEYNGGDRRQDEQGAIKLPNYHGAFHLLDTNSGN